LCASGRPSFCNAICPSRDSSQLTKTFAALGWGARVGIPSVPPAALLLPPAAWRSV
jgi:hypothetical protein